MSSDSDQWWNTSGLMIAGGWHPLSDRIRARIQSEDVESDYEWEYSEEHVLRLKELGITLLIGQFYRGLGDTDHARDQERAKDVAALCHKHGLRHGVYLPNYIFYESTLKDFPECEDWVVKTSKGRKTHYGGEATYLWITCLNSPGWRARMKSQIQRAIQYAKTDLLHFDNLGQSLEPDGCHCAHCQDAFRLFLSERYPTPESQVRRFGYTGFETFSAPVFWDPFSQPWHLDRIQSPLLQEWLEFRSHTVTDYIADLTSYAHELKPDICFDCNGQAFHGNNAGLSQGRGDAEGQSAPVHIMWEENPDLRPDDEASAIYPVTRGVRGMLFARRMGKQMVTSYDNEEDLSFNITFTGNPGINVGWGYAEPGRNPLNPHQPGIKDLLEHYKRHLNLYTQCSPASRVAVWRNQRSLLFVCFDTHLSACVMEHILFTRRIPFSIVQDGSITPEALSQFDLLIIPNVQFVSDEQAQILTRFVDNGGRLLITESSGMYNGEPRIRRAPAFDPLFAGQVTSSNERLVESANIDESKQHVARKQDGAAAYANYGNGSVAYLPSIDYLHPPKTFKSNYNVHYDGIDSRYWKEPHNVDEIVTTLERLYPQLYPVRIEGVPELRLDYLTTNDGTTCIPFVRCGKLSGPCDIPIAIQASTTEDAILRTPENKEPTHLAWRKKKDHFEIALPAIHRHGVLSYRTENTEEKT